MSDISQETIVEFHHPDWPEDTARTTYAAFTQHYEPNGFVLTPQVVAGPAEETAQENYFPEDPEE